MSSRSDSLDGRLPNPGPPEDVGYWETLPFDSRVLAVHAALLPTGKVLFVRGSGSEDAASESPSIAALWDYPSPRFRVFSLASDAFCCGHAFLGDGRLLLAGGTLDTVKAQGISDAYLFDPWTEEFIRVMSMFHPRYYPTVVGRSDGQPWSLAVRTTTIPLGWSQVSNRIGQRKDSSSLVRYLSYHSILTSFLCGKTHCSMRAGMLTVVARSTPDGFICPTHPASNQSPLTSRVSS